MRFIPQDPPRVFSAGQADPVMVRDCGRVFLEADEQITFVTEGGGEYDVTRKAWGFYATPSINARLVTEGFKTALVRNRVRRYYIMLVDVSRLAEFSAYLQREASEVVEWLDEREK